MSKVSVTGAKSVMEEVVATAHDLRMLHVTEYDGSWESFRPGDPVEGAETASDKLVTVRSLLSILGLDEADVSAAQSIDDEALAERLESVRERVNELDDRRSSLRDELRGVEERLGAIEPFVDLGIDLDLLQGYETVQVAVGRGSRDRVERTLVEADGIEAYQFFEGEDDLLAIVARPAGAGLPRDAGAAGGGAGAGADGDADEQDGRDVDEGALSDALVGTEFQALQIPDVEDDEATSPDDYAARLRERRNQLRAKLDTVENELREVRAEDGSFLLAAEEELAIRVQKTEAPLTFATTRNAFVAEGWVPTERYTEFASALQEAVGEHVEIEELERAEFNHDGTDHSREEVPGTGGAEPGTREAPAAADGGHDETARADGGVVTMRNDDPPVVQDNPGAMKPFEVLVRAVGLPKYSEFDPTVILFLTFPAFFGFMIGDVGYGLIYTGIGYFLYSRLESDALRSMGGVTIAAGLFTVLFGLLYGELFGLHVIGDTLWGGHPPMEKGLSPAGQSYALTWLLVSVLIGVVHLNIGFVFDFVENYRLHSPRDAVLESGSWLLMLNGLWVWVLSRPQGVKPAFLYTVFDGTGAAPEAGGAIHATYALGFNGFPSIVGLLAAVAFFAGILLAIASGDPGEAIEAIFAQVLINGLSYTRITAVLLAKAGMAFAVNLLFFGVGTEETEAGTEWHFLLTEGPQEFLAHHEEAGILFTGLVHSGPAAVVVGLLVLVLGHLLVLALGVTSAGLQAVRLEYVEFFGKFYDGGGRAYEPFGRERRFSRER